MTTFHRLLTRSELLPNFAADCVAGLCMVRANLHIRHEPIITEYDDRGRRSFCRSPQKEIYTRLGALAKRSRGLLGNLTRRDEAALASLVLLTWVTSAIWSAGRASLVGTSPGTDKRKGGRGGPSMPLSRSGVPCKDGSDSGIWYPSVDPNGIS